jgi:hypothetical protein
MSKCESCGTSVPSYDTVHYGNASKSETLCTACFNAVAADQMGIEIDQANFEPITLKGSDGRRHVFQIRRRLCPTGQVLESFEVRRGVPAGYQFAILGDFTEDPMELLARLYQRMRRGLERKHLQKSKYGTHLVSTNPIRGRISSDYDREPEPLPVIVIDGREFRWEQFGRMLLSFEGWQFRLEIVDRTDEG